MGRYAALAMSDLVVMKEWLMTVNRWAHARGFQVILPTPTIRPKRAGKCAAASGVPGAFAAAHHNPGGQRGEAPSAGTF